MNAIQYNNQELNSIINELKFVQESIAQNSESLIEDPEVLKMFRSVLYFDHFADYSDDPSVYRSANRRKEELTEKAKMFPELKEVFIAGLCRSTLHLFKEHFKQEIERREKITELNSVINKHAHILYLHTKVGVNKISAGCFEAFFSLYKLLDESHELMKNIKGYHVLGTKVSVKEALKVIEKDEYEKVIRKTSINLKQSDLIDEVYVLLDKYRLEIIENKNLFSYKMNAIIHKAGMGNKFILSTYYFRTVI